MDDLHEIGADRTHGAAWLSLRALELLRNRARNVDDWSDVVTFARDLCTVRPSMYVITTRVNRAMYEAKDRTPNAVVRSAEEVRRNAAAADENAAVNAAEKIVGSRILTLSHSGTVVETLRRADPGALYVLESRPEREGVDVAESIAESMDVTLSIDAAVGHLLAVEDVDTVLVGADTVLPDGTVINKVGTRTAATVASRERTDVVVVCARDKVAPSGTTEAFLESGDPADIYNGEVEIMVKNPTFDRTPPELVDAVITEAGVLDQSEVCSVSEEHSALADWVS